MLGIERNTREEDLEEAAAWEEEDRKVGDLGLGASAAQTPYPLEEALSLGAVTATEDFFFFWADSDQRGGWNAKGLGHTQRVWYHF